MPDAIIDAHHHIWRLSETPWLQGPPVPRIFGAYDAIRRDYAIEDYLADARPSGVVKSVFVQVNVAPGKEVDEAAWVQSVADVNGFPHAITAYADLASPVGRATRSTASLPAATCAPSASSCTGTRTPLYRFAPRPDVMNDAAWRRGLDEVRRRGLMFELQVFAEPDARCRQARARLSRRHLHPPARRHARGPQRRRLGALARGHDSSWPRAPT